jgi:malonyl-CoA/methylmalonyl-CoA synthetase
LSFTVGKHPRERQQNSTRRRLDTSGADRTAIVAAEGTFTYRQLLQASRQIAAGLLDGAPDLNGARVAFLAPPGWHYVAVQWGIWRAGGVAVPLATSHPPPELDYVISDSAAAIVVAHPEYDARLRPIAAARGLRLALSPELLGSSATANLPVIDASRRALMLYTSGTTSKPKGAVTTHANIQAQVESLVTAWEWTPRDRIIHVLPLHHIHGIINVLTCALWSGATCEILPKFDPEKIWTRFIDGDVTLFMAVPTVYLRLVAAWEAAPPERQRALTAACANLRLMVCGSAALPVTTLERWQQVSGHVLLERYGMTETGMILSNPLHGERRPGSVGTPLPGIEVRLVDEAGQSVPAGTPGEIQVRGPGVFREYWQRPDVTAKSFRDGWFCTGDIAVFENGMYRILGRSSVDIIKTGGYKVSALEIEEVLRTHPHIQECAVIGIPDPTWGERVCAVAVLHPEKQLALDPLRSWAKELLAAYKIPSKLVVLDALPRNAMGKVVKPELARTIATRG